MPEANPSRQAENDYSALQRNTAQKNGSKLIWASTTIVPEGEEGRFIGDDVKYNAAARRIMEKHGIPIDDLHTLTAGFAATHFAGNGDVHYAKEGCAKIAAQVAESIRQDGLAKQKESSR